MDIFSREAGNCFLAKALLEGNSLVFTEGVGGETQSPRKEDPGS